MYFSLSLHPDFEDVAVENGGFVEFTLGYDFFYELVYNNAGVKSTANEDILQSISISIRPAVNEPVGVIFYSRTMYSQQLLEVRQRFMEKLKTPAHSVTRNKRTVLFFTTEAKEVLTFKSVT